MHSVQYAFSSVTMLILAHVKSFKESIQNIDVRYLEFEISSDNEIKETLMCTVILTIVV